MKTNRNYNAHLASLSDKKLLYDFTKEMYFDVKAPGKKSTGDKSLEKILKSPGLKISASGSSNTINLSCNPNELCIRLKLLVQEK